MLGLVLCLLPFLAGAQEASRRGASVHYNNSRRIPYYSWAMVDYTVNNPTDRPVDVSIRFNPISQRNITVYENSFTLGPGLQYQYQMPVTIGTMDQYAIDMFLDKTRVTNANQRKVIIRLAQSEDHFIVFINDDDDLFYGNFARSGNLNGLYVSTLNRAEKAATHFAGYDNAYIVVLYRPDYERMTSRQYDALLDHVARGGTLLFGDPQGAMEAWKKTPLRKCLPVTPLRLRQIEHLNALAEIGGAPVFWPDGRQFLESMPRGDGVTTLMHEEFPLVRWGSYGLGRVGVCTVNPSLETFRFQHEGQNFAVFWRHILSNGGRISYPSSSQDPSLTTEVDQLTGIDIPTKSLIRNMILVYMVLIIIFVSIGFYLKKHVWSWIGLAAIALFTTWAVFVYARFRQRKLSPKTATLLEFINHGAEEKSAEQLVSLTLLGEKTLDLRNDDVDLMLRSFPPARREQKTTTRRPKNKPKDKRTPKSGKSKPGMRDVQFREADRGVDEDLRDPLKISQRDGLSSLENLTLRKAKPQFYGTLKPLPGKPLKDLPIVRWTASGPQIDRWQLPADIPGKKTAILLCENGYYGVSVNGNSISLKGRGAAVEQKNMSEFLARAPHPAPSLVVFTPVQSDATGFIAKDHSAPDQRFDKVSGLRTDFIPVIDELAGESVIVPFERVRLVYRDLKSRVLVRNGQFQKVSPTGRTEGTPYPIGCFLPPTLNWMQMTTVKVDFGAENRGGNMAFKVFVRAKGQEDNGIELQPSGNETYSVKLTPEQSANLLEHSDAYFEIVILPIPKKYIKDPVQRLRQNTWKIRRLRVGAEGTLPPAYRGRL